MLTTRLLEEEIVKEYPNKEIRCPVHLSIGQEAISAGVSKILKIIDICNKTPDLKNLGFFFIDCSNNER